MMALEPVYRLGLRALVGDEGRHDVNVRTEVIVSWILWAKPCPNATLHVETLTFVGSYWNRGYAPSRNVSVQFKSRVYLNPRTSKLHEIASQ